MQQYRKLFNISEIEYVTLFMKVWMAFNAWYRKDSPNIKRDQEAIIFYKSNGDIKKYFLILLHEQSHIGINFRTALYDFVELIEKNILQDKI